MEGHVNQATAACRLFVHLMPFLYALFVLRTRLTGDSRLTIEEMREDNGDKLLPKPFRLHGHCGCFGEHHGWRNKANFGIFKNWMESLYGSTC